MKLQTAEWVHKAEGDRAVALREMQAPHPVYDVVCFLAQQSAEKYLKAWLVEQGIAFPRTHDLVVLFNLTGNTLPGLQPRRGDLAHLTTFAVAARYPGVSTSKTEATEAIEIANAVRGAVRQRLGLS